MSLFSSWKIFSHTTVNRLESRKMVGGEGTFVGLARVGSWIAKDDDDWLFVDV